MLTKTRVILFTFMIAFVLLMSAIYIPTAYADDESPPVEPPAATEPAEPPTQDGVIEEAALTPLETDSASAEIPAAGAVESILAEIPQGTDIVVVNEEGNAIPLATEAAAQAVASGDPIWCPAGVATPVANMNGCSGSYTTFAALFTDPFFASGGPAKDGTIWIEGNYVGGYNGNDNAAITLNGGMAAFNVMKDFKLTLKGGWNGIGTNTVNPATPSTFDVPILIQLWNNDVTLSNIVITGTATGADALEVGTTKNIILTNVQSTNNTGRGAHLHNDVSGTGNVAVTNSTFNNNSGVHGLLIDSNGIITLKDVTANLNFNGYGAYLDNDAASTAKAVILSGTNNFNNNGTSSGFSGLYVTSKGQITVNNVIASNNGQGAFGQGAELYNNVATSTSGITLTGTNIFSDNHGNGLSIASFGAIKINNVYANSNGGMGASLFNSLAGTSQIVTLSGTNEFKYNGSLGVFVSSRGQITINNITANSNGNVGASLNNTPSTTAAGVTLTGTNYFNNNFYTGTNIQTTGIVLMNNITASGNGASNSSGYGVSISNGGLVNFKSVTLTGSNSFSNNYEDGLVIFSSGVITLNNITASENEHGFGARLDNTASGSSIPKAVTLTGTNIFSDNFYVGLQFNSYGAITTNNITANGNGLSSVGGLGTGVLIYNDSASTPQNVTLNGSNTFNDNFEDGLQVNSKGAIRTSTVTANDNNSYGVYLSNNGGPGTSTVTMTGSNKMTGNNLDNLYIQSAGAITLNNITASNSVTEHGAYVLNTAGVAKPVTLTGTNQFNGNDGFGLVVLSNGLITINMLTANDNGTGGENGAYLDNVTSTTKAGVTLTGTNQFDGNGTSSGLYIKSLGSVKLNSLNANSNGAYGVIVDITSAGAVGGITLTGTNIASGNASDNFYLTAVGTITLTNINSTGSINGAGANITNTASGTSAPKPVTLTGTNIFSNNANGGGLSIFSYGVITTNTITASNNGNFGTYLSNSGAATAVGINVLGTNLFESNNLGGLYVESKGLIKTNNITANNSAGGYGASLNNASAGITMTGTNSFSNNRTLGLNVVSNGIITVSNVTASFTTNGIGANINNLGSGFAAPKAVTLSGNNNFNSNANSGLVISTYGAITINNLTASDNGLGAVNGKGADLDNYNVDSTIPSSVTLTGNSTFINNFEQGLNVESFGAIKINNLTASLNGSQGGATLNNKLAPTNAYGVTLTGKSTFDTNTGNGLKIDTKGAVLIGGINSTNNTVYGVYIINNYAGPAAPKPVTLTGVNVLTNNTSTGLSITTNGVVTISSVTASGASAGFGAVIDNSTASTAANVIFTGFNVFNNNGLNGLLINSKGAITLSNITANDNGFSGLDINNSTGTAGVTLTGMNTFNGNGDNGATILSSGAVSITKISGDENGQSGLSVSTPGAVSITCGSFNLNTWYGWEVSNALSTLTIKGVFTAGNTLGDFINNAASTVTVRNCPLP